MEMQIKYGDYKIIKKIGSGGFGQVYLAKNIFENREYAIKIIDINRIINENLDKNIEKEVGLMKKIDHPYIAKLYEVMSTNQKILLVMEYIDGGDLFDAIKSGHNSKLNETTARCYFQQIIIGLEHLHNQNILHRDLKPENILLDKRNKCIKITDFGLSTSIDTKDQIISDLAGTTLYLAPEVIKQTGYQGQAADVWSTGVILFHSITGGVPFNGKQPDQILKKILSADVTYPCFLSSDLIDLLKNIFVVNPNQRYTIAQIKKHPWFIKSKLINNIVCEISNVTEKDKGTNKFNSTQENNVKLLKFFIEPSDVSSITCFELIAMVSGNILNKMLNRNKNREINSDDFTYKYMTALKLEEACDVICNHFTNMGLESDIKFIEKSQYVIDVNLKNKKNQISLGVYKMSIRKFVFIFKFKMVKIFINCKGDKSLFKKLMKSFYNSYEGVFKIF